MAEIKIALCIPTAGTVKMSFAYSLSSLMTHFVLHKMKTVPEATTTMAIQIMEGSNWINNREKLARMSINVGATHLFFLDDDMRFEPQVLEILVGRRQALVTTNYLIKTEPACDAEFVAVDLDGQRIPTTEDSTGIQPILFSGFGVSLIETRVFEKTAQPWFMPDFHADSGEYTTEDNPFFRRAREAGFTAYVDHDASKLVSHVGSKTWDWREVTNAQPKA